MSLDKVRYIEKEIIDEINDISGAHSSYEVLSDWIRCCSLSICNACHIVHNEVWNQREKDYVDTIGRYPDGTEHRFAGMLCKLADLLSEKMTDALGEIYMEADMGGKVTGQFFTPYHVCHFMAACTIQDDQLKAQLDEHGWISICDCACGAGATLVAAANYLRSIGINYQMQALFVAQDVDATVALMCYIQLSLLGCAGYVVIGNSITEPMTGNVLFGEESSRCWYTPMYYHAVWDTRRAIAAAKSIFQRVATAIPSEAPEQATANMPEAESAGNSQEESTSAPAPEAQDEYTPTFTISTRKKDAGQLMFDFG